MAFALELGVWEAMREGPFHMEADLQRTFDELSERI